MPVASLDFRPVHEVAQEWAVDLKTWVDALEFDDVDSAKITLEFHAKHEFIPDRVEFIYRSQLVLYTDGLKLWVHRHSGGITSWTDSQGAQVSYNPDLQSLFPPSSTSRQLLLRCADYRGTWKIWGHRGTLNTASFFELGPEEVPQHG
jgi:hypothetical protein